MQKLLLQVISQYQQQDRPLLFDKAHLDTLDIDTSYISQLTVLSICAGTLFQTIIMRLGSLNTDISRMSLFETIKAGRLLEAKQLFIKCNMPQLLLISEAIIPYHNFSQAPISRLPFPFRPSQIQSRLKLQGTLGNKNWTRTLVKVREIAKKGKLMDQQQGILFLLSGEPSLIQYCRRTMQDKRDLIWARLYLLYYNLVLTNFITCRDFFTEAIHRSCLDIKPIQFDVPFLNFQNQIQDKGLRVIVMLLLAKLQKGESGERSWLQIAAEASQDLGMTIQPRIRQLIQQL